MKPTVKLDVRGRRGAAEATRVAVMELHLPRGTADLIVREPVLAPGAIPLPDLALHVRRDEVGRGRRRLLARRLHEPLPLSALREEEVEGGLEDLLGGCTRVGMGKSVARTIDLCEELAGDRQVQPPQRRGERLDLPRTLLGRGPMVGIDEVGWPTSRRRRVVWSGRLGRGRPRQVHR
jgi:hypothetical protein